jgi:hypothetical protein
VFQRNPWLPLAPVSEQSWFDVLATLIVVLSAI